MNEDRISVNECRNKGLRGRRGENHGVGECAWRMGLGQGTHPERFPNGSRRLPEEMEVGGMTQEMARSFHEAMKAESTKETRRSDMRNSMNTFRCGHMTRHPDMSSLKKTSLKKRASIHYNIYM